MKSMMRFTMLLILVIVYAPSNASDVSLPNAFTAGTPAVAAEVNANFSALESAVNDNDGRVDIIEQKLATPVRHIHSVNPGAFMYNENTTDISMNIYYGLRWVADSTERAGFYMSRPADWDQTTNIEVRITFAVSTSEAGAVNWRLFLNTYTPNTGEWLTNPAARDADQIRNFTSVLSSLRIYDQTFTLIPSNFNDEPYWSLFFQRGNEANGETFASILYVMGVDVSYQTK